MQDLLCHILMIVSTIDLNDVSDNDNSLELTMQDNLRSHDVGVQSVEYYLSSNIDGGSVELEMTDDNNGVIYRYQVSTLLQCCYMF